MLNDPATEIVVQLVAAVALLPLFFNQRRNVLGARPMAGPFFGNGYAETAAVDVIQLDIQNLKAYSLGHPIDLPKSIVADVFVTDCVVRIAFNHQRQIALLEDPDAIIVEHIVHLPHKCRWIFEVIEHRDRRDDLRFSQATTLLKQFRIKEIWDAFNPFWIIV